MLIARFISQKAALRLRSLSARQSDRDHFMCTSLNNLHKSPTPTANECRPFHSTHTTLAGKQNHNKKPQRRSKDNQDRSKSNQKPPPNSKRERKFNKMLKKHAEASPKEIPPAYLTRTASPNVYIATSAIMNGQGGDLLVDPLTLFAEYTNHSSKNSAGVSSTKQRKNSLIPHIFRQSHLQYFSPAVFPNHEPPTDGTPEVCFLGRSNTGKSSLINALHSLILKSGGGGGGRNKNTTASGGGELARTSKTPGRTQTINYFGLVSNNAKSASNDAPKAKLFLVDMPGFGYASAPDESVDAWQKRTQEFLISRTLVPEEQGDTVKPWPSASKTSARDKKAIQHIASAPPLKRLYLLIDSRLKEPQYIDLSVMGWCDEYSIPYTLVLTKVDGSSRAHCVKLTNQLCMRYHSLLMDQAFNEEGEGELFMDPVVYWTSAKDGLGMEELLSSVEGCLLDRHDDSEMYGLDDIGFEVDEKDLDEEDDDDDSDWELEDDEIDSDSQNADVT